MDANKSLLILVLFVSLLAETQGKSFPENGLQDTGFDDNSELGNGLSEDKINYENENYNDDGNYNSDDINEDENDNIEDEIISDSEDNSDFSDDLSEDKINYENENYNDDGNYNSDDINEDENDNIEDEIISDSEDNSDFSDDLSEDKINYENENYNDDGDYNSDDINEDENDNIEDEIISDSEDNSEFSDDLSEDKINYENENYNDDGDYNRDDNENDNIEDENSEDNSEFNIDFSENKINFENAGNDVSASDLIYAANENAHILNNVFEEDILVDKDRQEEVSDWISGTVITKRAAIKGDKYRWPNKILSYRLEQSFGYTDATFNQAINEISSKTCVRFRRLSSTATPSGPYVGVISGSGCYSYVGNLNNGRQELSIGRGCNYVGTIVHELLHALGFWHEQSRPDRDNFVKILYENIEAGTESNFKKHSENIIQDLGVPYDFLSVMHYGNTAFSINGQPTIIARHNPDLQFGQRNGLSPNDVKKVNLYYKCPNNPTSTSAPPTGIVTPGTTKSCNFDEGFCEWENIGRRPFIRRRGGTPSRRTGPSADHTSGQGQYIYLETSRPVRSGQYAAIQSELKEATNALCMRFWYSMRGKHMGELIMGIREPSSNKLNKVLWSEKGNIGKDWKYASVTLKYAKRFHAVFVAVKGSGWQSDIALDDIGFKPGPCSKGPVTGPVTSAKCDFAENFCSFTNIGVYRLKAGYISMYADGLKSKEGEATSLTSPELSPPQATQNTCVSFRYFLTLSDAGSRFTVSFTDRNGGDKKELVTFKGNRGDQWHEYQIQFRSPVIHKVIFEARRGASASDRIYLDDISIGPGPCPKSVCGEVTYEPTKKTCCAGILHTTEAGKQCCGSVYYSVSKTRQCCSKGSRVISTYAVC